MLLPGKDWIYVVAFGVVSLLLQILVPYTTYVEYLKWLTLSLFAYVATAFFVKISWHAVVRATVLPQLSWSKDYLKVFKGKAVKKAIKKAARKQKLSSDDDS